MAETEARSRRSYARTLSRKGYDGICCLCLVKRYCKKGGVLAGNGCFGRFSIGYAPACPTTHPPDRTAARFLDGKGISFAVRRVMTAVGQVNLIVAFAAWVG